MNKKYKKNIQDTYLNTFIQTFLFEYINSNTFMTA